MNEITVTLKNGKDIKFQSELGTVEVKKRCDNAEVIPTDKAFAYVNGNEIAAIQSQPLAHCMNCGKWVMPNQQSVFGKGKVIDTILTCPECEAKIPESVSND